MMLPFLLRSALMATALGALCVTPALSGPIWEAANSRIDGTLRAGSREVPVVPGDMAQVQIRNGVPGSSYEVLRGTQLLTPVPVVADDKGSATITVAVPADAEPGNQPLTVVAHDPAGIAIVDLKLSRIVPASGMDGFDFQAGRVSERAYQVAVSRTGKLFVASASGRRTPSELQILDATTLAVEGDFDLPKQPGGDGVIEVFGVGVDDANGRVWATNTLDNTVTVFDIATRKMLKMFPKGSVEHPRDVVIDDTRNRAYVNAALSGTVHVFDTVTLEQVGTIFFDAARGLQVFSTMTLDLDIAAGRLYTISRDTPWVGWADLATGAVKTFAVPGLSGGSGIAHDPKTGRIFIAGQDSNNLMVLDENGKVLADTYIGAGGISVVWDPTLQRIFAATRAGGTVAVLDVDGNLLANLPMGDLPNQLVLGPDGDVYAVSMLGAVRDGSDHGTVTKIIPTK